MKPQPSAGETTTGPSTSKTRRRPSKSLKAADKSRRGSATSSQRRAGRARAPSQADVTGADETNFLTTGSNAETLGHSIQSEAETPGRSIQSEESRLDRRRPPRKRRSVSSGNVPPSEGQPSADQTEKVESSSAPGRRRSKSRQRVSLVTHETNPPSQPESQLPVKPRQSTQSLEEAPPALRGTSTLPQPLSENQVRAEQKSSAPGIPTASEPKISLNGLAQPVDLDAARGNGPSPPATARRPSFLPKSEVSEAVIRRFSSGTLREKQALSKLGQPELSERALGEDPWSSSGTCQTTQPQSPTFRLSHYESSAFLLPHYEEKRRSWRGARAWKRIRHAGGKFRRTKKVVQMPGFNYYLTATVVGLVLAVVIFIAVALGRLSLDDGGDNTCHTHECRDYARRLALSLNKSVSPCQSFTRFVCDGWQRDNRISVKRDLDWQLLDRIGRLVRRMDIPTTNQSEPQKAAALYVTCDEIVHGNRDDLAAVKAALAEAGITWPHRGQSIDVVRLLLSASVKLGWDVYLRVVPGRFGDRDGVLIDRGALFGHVARRPAMPASEKEDYFNALRESFSDNAMESGDNNMARFEDTMATEDILMPILQRAYGEARNPIELSAGTLSGREWGLKELEKRWRPTLEELGFIVPVGTNVHVARPAYVKTFAHIWRLLGDANLHDMVSWGTVQVAALHANRNLTLNFYRGHQPLLNHGAFCLSVVYRLMGHALFRMYSAKVLTRFRLKEAKLVTGRVREALRQRLSSWRHYADNVTVVANWTTLDTAFAAFSYTSNVTRVAGFNMSDSLVANWQRSVRMADVDDRDISIADALASRQLTALLPGVDFQLMPYSMFFLHFHPDLDVALNFGGLGALVALALGRLFITAYAQEASKSRLFSAFSDCIASGAFSCGQDVDITMAEVLSLRALVSAYNKTVVQGKSGIVDLEGYTGLQLLFIAACYLRCEGSDVGNSARLCDISFQYVPEFAEAFGCVPGTPLNPFRQCTLSQK